MSKKRSAGSKSSQRDLESNPLVKALRAEILRLKGENEGLESRLKSLGDRSREINSRNGG